MKSCETCRGHQQLCQVWHQLDLQEKAGLGSGPVPLVGWGCWGFIWSAEAWSPQASPQYLSPIPDPDTFLGKTLPRLSHSTEMLILQDRAPGGCAFLCSLSSLAAAINAVATKWNQTLVFRNTCALPHAVCCSLEPLKRCWSVFYEYQCGFRKSDLNIAACFPGRPCSCILTAAKAAPSAQHSLPLPKDRQGLVILHLARTGLQSEGLPGKRDGWAGFSTLWCAAQVCLCGIVHWESWTQLWASWSNVEASPARSRGWTSRGPSHP